MNVPPRRRSGDQRDSEWCAAYLEAVIAGDAAAAEAVVAAALRDGMAPAAVHTRVITPAMYRVGELWQCDALSVADEHLATAISHGVLAQLFQRLLTAPSRSRERVLLAATEGEHHVLGLRMTADVLEGAGFDVLFLGANVPVGALLAACRTHRPALLGLSVTMAANVAALISVLADLQYWDERPAVIVGGGAVQPAIDRGLRVTAVEHSETIVSVVESVLAAPWTGLLVADELVHSFAAEAPAAAGATDPLAAAADAFSATALAAADATRDARRDAFAMEQLAYHDSLTGLWNRRAYDDRCQEATALLTGEAVLLMLDIDHFKEINDGHGHEAGDRVLVEVARVISDNIRPTDFAARFGGDEFVVLLASTATTDGVTLADRIRCAVQRELTDPPVAVSIGVAAFDGGQRTTALAVDGALYAAKEGGRNRVALTSA